MDTKGTYTWVFWVLVLFAVSGIYISIDTNRQNDFQVTFLDVGQGDATFIQTSTGFQILIDGGKGSRVLRKLSDVMPSSDRTIDMIVVTHADTDHYGGLSDILKRFKVDYVVHTNEQKDSRLWREFLKLVEKENAKEVHLNSPKQLLLSDGTMIRFLWPWGEIAESNAGSIITHITKGDNSILITGDAPKEVEKLMIKTFGKSLQSKILQAGHHGSKTSTASEFLSIVNPEFVIVSAGLNNNHGHPHESVVETIKDHGSKLLETSKEGNISFVETGGRLLFVGSQ